MNTLSQMKHSELAAYLEAAIPALLPTLITGAPGIGKTELVESVARKLGADIILSHPVVSDPTDFKGLPAKVSDTEASFLPFGDLLAAMSAKRLTLWFFDDLGQAAPSVQAACMQLFLKREINGKRISDHICFVAATNRRQDKAGVSGILEPVKSRFVSIIELVADSQEWSTWAIGKSLSPTLIAFNRLRPDLLSQFNPTADMTNSPSPRTIFNLSRIEALGLPANIEAAAMAGATGEGYAVEYLAFKKMAASLVSVDAILAAPDKADLPKKPSEAYAVCTALAARANDKTLGRIGIYAERLARAGQGEFSALTVRDCLRRNPKLANTSEYVKMMCGPIGELISGQSVTL